MALIVDRKPHLARFSQSASQFWQQEKGWVAMSLGELTQSAAAFVVVQGGFNWLVDNYRRLANWRSSAHRVATLLIALDELGTKERADAPPLERR